MMERKERRNAFVGKWVSSQPFDSDDYLVEYTITKAGSSLTIEARDYRDGESMEISDITFDGNTLEFVSLMPSTGRRGLNRFSIKESDVIVSEFTFTVVETLKRMSSKESKEEGPKDGSHRIPKRRIRRES